MPETRPGIAPPVRLFYYCIYWQELLRPRFWPELFFVRQHKCRFRKGFCATIGCSTWYPVPCSLRRIAVACSHCSQRYWITCIHFLAHDWAACIIALHSLVFFATRNASDLKCSTTHGGIQGICAGELVKHSAKRFYQIWVIVQMGFLQSHGRGHLKTSTLNFCTQTYENYTKLFAVIEYTMKILEVMLSHVPH